MLEIYAYNAGKGDCLRIHYAETHNIFVDTGVTRFAPRFKQICEEIIGHDETLDALLLTHVDDDHIGGVLANLRFSDYVCPFKEIWMNHDGDGFVGDTNLSTRQNDEVYARLLQRGITVRAMRTGDLHTAAGATIEIVWPEVLSRDQSRVDTLLAHHNDYRIPLSTLADMPIAVHDVSMNNKNSIVFTFSYEGKRLLLTGDAWAEDVVKATGNYDLVKLPHHGSVRNISDAFPAAIRSNYFLICTDGRDHPDKQTIAKLEKWYGEINVYSPVAWWDHGYFQPGDKEHKINYQKKEGLVIAW